MSTFVASLYLPYTIDFSQLPMPVRRQSPPPNVPSTNTTPVSILDDLHTHARRPSLFDAPTPPRTPSTEVNIDNFFTQTTLNPAANFMKPQDPHAFARTDSHVPEWGRGALFNQPPSLAIPPPRQDVRNFAPSSLEIKAVDPPPRSDINFDRPRWENRDAARRRQSHSNHTSRSPRRKFGGDWSVVPADQGNGGLTNAIKAAQRNGKMEEIFWVGTIGFPTDTVPDSVKEDIHDRLESEYDALTVFVRDSDFDGHYTHFCKTILWPVFHYQIPDHPKSKAYEDHSWKYYVNLNQTFADKIIANYKRNDVIWAHDYHLLLLPGMVRKKIPDAKIGFFLHTAFPSSEVFRCLAQRKALLEGMLGANLIVFQNPEYAEHFLTTCSRLLVVEATREGVQLENHFVNVASVPIGVDPEGLRKIRDDRAVKEWIKVMQTRYEGKKIIVARDKLDPIRGVRQKLLAYELFLNQYPEWCDKVVLIQVATSTTENKDLAAVVSEIVTRIDSQHSTLVHSPLVFLRQDIAFSQYLALLTVADVLMVTSMREGMNLTCHEYIICQDGELSNKRHGPVILSEFTGSASQFKGNQISINPWDYKQCAQAIKTALEMSPEEKSLRYRNLNEIVTTNNAASWINKLDDGLKTVCEEQFARQTLSIPRLSVSQVSDRYTAANRRVLILDYEGTLASHNIPINIHLQSSQRVRNTLNDLIADPKNVVYIMSAKMPDELERVFDTVPGLGLIAENGCFMREYGKDEWTSFIDEAKTASWMSAVKAILPYYQERIEGSSIEERHCSLVFKYDKAADKEAANRLGGECADHINDACSTAQQIHAVPINQAVLIEPLEWSKGSASTYILEGLRKKAPTPADFLLVAGDDREDEIVFRWANKLGKEGEIKYVETVSVGKRQTEAMATLAQGPTGLLSVLQRLSRLR